MPEGHTLRRLADEISGAFAGAPVRVSSPQGRFATEAALLDGAVLDSADSAGKHLFLEFEGDRIVHIHLGLIGGFAVHPAVAEVPPPVGAVRLRLIGSRPGADPRRRGRQAGARPAASRRRPRPRVGPDLALRPVDR
jgi:formamidopyrimidine-DNA glycosylase